MVADPSDNCQVNVQMTSAALVSWNTLFTPSKHFLPYIVNLEWRYSEPGLHGKV